MYYGGYSEYEKIIRHQGPNVTVVPSSGVTMKLSWNKLDNMTVYEIYRSVSENGIYEYVKATTGTSTSDTGRTAGTRYYYKVRAYKEEGNNKIYTGYSKIINVISYVLIAFVAISLVVSSIMIGVITYISVLERKKEIGILRAIGASKHNISQVFNAETFIIGLLAGVLGIAITLLLLIPGNMLIHGIAGTTSVSAQLPVNGAVTLITLSVILTLIGGLIPSRKAAKSDPVTALRSE